MEAPLPPHDTSLQSEQSSVADETCEPALSFPHTRSILWDRSVVGQVRHLCVESLLKPVVSIPADVAKHLGYRAGSLLAHCSVGVSFGDSEFIVTNSTQQTVDAGSNSTGVVSGGAVGEGDRARWRNRFHAAVERYDPIPEAEVGSGMTVVHCLPKKVGFAHPNSVRMGGGRNSIDRFAIDLDELNRLKNARNARMQAKGSPVLPLERFFLL